MDDFDLLKKITIWPNPFLPAYPLPPDPEQVFDPHSWYNINYQPTSYRRSI